MVRKFVDEKQTKKFFITLTLIFGIYRDFRKSITLAVMAFVLRPTNIITWIFLGCILMVQAPTTWQRFSIATIAGSLGYAISQYLLTAISSRSCFAAAQCHSTIF